MIRRVIDSYFKSSHGMEIVTVMSILFLQKQIIFLSFKKAKPIKNLTTVVNLDNDNKNITLFYF